MKVIIKNQRSPGGGHACHSSQEAETGEPGILGQPGLHRETLVWVVLCFHFGCLLACSFTCLEGIRSSGAVLCL